VSGPAGSLPALQVHPTRRCNLRCPHCYSDSGPDVAERLGEGLLLRVLADAAALGYRVVSVSGGEPLLYEPLPRVLRAAHPEGLATTVTSNGLLLDAARLERLAPHLDLLALSLDGPPESHGEMRGAAGAFEGLLRRLEGVRASGVPFGFIFTLTLHNVHELDWAARFALEQGASLLQVHPLEPVGRAGRTLAGAVPDGEELAAAVIEVARLREELGERLAFQLDVASQAALARQPERVFACAEETCSQATFAGALAPLVLETDGTLAPLQHGFPRAWCLGNVKQAPLRALAESFARDRLRAFCELCSGLRDELLGRPAEPLFNWYVEVRRAAEQTGPRRALPAAV